MMHTTYQQADERQIKSLDKAAWAESSPVERFTYLFVKR